MNPNPEEDEDEQDLTAYLHEIESTVQKREEKVRQIYVENDTNIPTKDYSAQEVDIAIAQRFDPKKASLAGPEKVLPTQAVSFESSVVELVCRIDPNKSDDTEYELYIPDTSTKTFKIIGWTEVENESERTVFVRHTLLEYLDRKELARNYSDTLFPVIGKIQAHYDLKEITHIHGQDYLGLHNYCNCIGLALIWAKVRKENRTIQVMDSGNQYPMDRLQGLLTTFVVRRRKNQTKKKLSWKTVVVRILDIPRHPDDYPYIGMLGIGNSPQSGHRLLYDQESNDPLPSCASLWPQWNLRTGYVVSKDSLFVVSEVTSADRDRNYGSLLKHRTYVIIDAVFIYQCDYQFREYTNRKLPVQYDFIPYAPKILVLCEGVNELVIKRDQRGYPDHYNISCLYLTHPTDSPTLLDWRQFSNDFGKNEVDIDIPLKLMMASEEINDWIENEFEEHKCHLLFSLAERSEYHKTQRIFIELWNVFVRPSHVNGTYFHVYCLRISFIRASTLPYPLRCHHIYKHPVLFKPIITDANWQHFQQTLTEISSFFQDFDFLEPPQELVELVKIMSRKGENEFRNRGYYSYERSLVLQDNRLQFEDL